MWFLVPVLSTEGMWNIYISHSWKAENQNQKTCFHFEKFLDKMEPKAKFVGNKFYLDQISGLEL